MNKSDALKQLGVASRTLFQVAEAFNTVEAPIPREQRMTPHRPVVQGGELGSQNPAQPTLFEEGNYEEKDYIEHLYDMYYDGMISPLGHLLSALGQTLVQLEDQGDPHTGVQPEQAAKELADGIREASHGYFQEIAEESELNLAPSSDTTLLRDFAKLINEIAGDL